jgi:hypothetical protein
VLTAGGGYGVGLSKIGGGQIGGNGEHDGSSSQSMPPNRRDPSRWDDPQVYQWMAQHVPIPIPTLRIARIRASLAGIGAQEPALLIVVISRLEEI